MKTQSVTAATAQQCPRTADKKRKEDRFREDRRETYVRRGGGKDGKVKCKREGNEGRMAEQRRGRKEEWNEGGKEMKKERKQRRTDRIQKKRQKRNLVFVD